MEATRCNPELAQGELESPCETCWKLSTLTEGHLEKEDFVRVNRQLHFSFRSGHMVYSLFVPALSEASSHLLRVPRLS